MYLALAEQKSIGMNVYEYVCVCTVYACGYMSVCMGFVYYAKNAKTEKEKSNKKKPTKQFEI